MRVLFLIAMLLLVSCGGGEKKEPEPPAQPTPSMPQTGIDPAAARAAQSEAKILLQQLHTLETAYKAEYGEYAAPAGVLAAGGRFDKIGFQVPPSAQYTFTITASANSFSATAKANLDPDPTFDVWKVDQNGAITCVSNDATG